MKFEISIIDRFSSDVLDQFSVVFPSSTATLAFARHAAPYWLKYRPVYKDIPAVRALIDFLLDTKAWQEMDVGVESCNRIEIRITHIQEEAT